MGAHTTTSADVAIKNNNGGAERDDMHKAYKENDVVMNGGNATRGNAAFFTHCLTQNLQQA